MSQSDQNADMQVTLVLSCGHEKPWQFKKDTPAQDVLVPGDRVLCEKCQMQRLIRVMIA